MDLGLTGRTAVVTGASRGIGAATVRMLEEEGARVLAVSRSQGIDVTALDAAEQIAERLGGARRTSSSTTPARASRRPLDELTEEDWQAQWELHVMASMRLMRAFAPAMAERGWGRIVNVDLVGRQAPVAHQRRLLGDQGRPGLALARVRRHLRRPGRARQRGRARPRRLASCGWPRAGSPTRPREARGLSREESIEVQAGKTTLGRFGTPEEIASVVVFLCSERAADVTGANWSVDGGTVATIV